MLFWKSLAFSMIQWMLAIWSLFPLPFLNPACTSGSSQFTFSWSLAWRILSNTLVACEGFPDSSVGKESACNAGDPSLIPGLGDLITFSLSFYNHCPCVLSLLALISDPLLHFSCINFQLAHLSLSWQHNNNVYIQLSIYFILTFKQLKLDWGGGPTFICQISI